MNAGRDPGPQLEPLVKIVEGKPAGEVVHHNTQEQDDPGGDKRKRAGPFLPGSSCLLLFYYITHSNNGMNEFAIMIVAQLLAQVIDINIHHISAHVEVDAPNIFQQFYTRQNATAIADHELKQPVFSRGKRGSPLRAG